MRSTPSRPPWATTSCAPPGMTSSAGWKISRTATAGRASASSCAAQREPGAEQGGGVDVVPAGVADAVVRPRPTAGRCGPATGSASRSARSATRYAASPRPEVGDQAGAGQRAHPDAGGARALAGDERRSCGSRCGRARGGRAGRGRTSTSSRASPSTVAAQGVGEGEGSTRPADYRAGAPAFQRRRGDARPGSGQVGRGRGPSARRRRP